MRAWRTLLGLVVIMAIAGAAGAPPSRPATPASIRSGDVREFAVPSRHQRRSRRVWVYTPPGYAASPDTSFGIVVAFDGEEYLSEIPLPRMLDSLVAVRAAPPMVAVLVDDSTSAARLDDLANRAWFVAWLSDELVPWVRARWHVTHDAHRVIVTGSSAGGLAAARAGLERPDVFGNVLSQSGAFWRGNEASNDAPYEWLTAQAGRWPRRDVRFWMEVGSTESRGALGGQAPSILSANRSLRDTLVARGYHVTYAEVPNGVHAPETWRTRLPAGIVALTASAHD